MIVLLFSHPVPRPKPQHRRAVRLRTPQLCESGEGVGNSHTHLSQLIGSIIRESIFSSTEHILYNIFVKSSTEQL